jgi:hypothetical protein
MTVQQIINFEHVECLKITSDTTVYVRFVSGTGEVFEFKDAEKLNDMTKAFLDWGYDSGTYKVYFIDNGGKND